MPTKFRIALTGLLFSLLLSSAYAERLYVTDRILLGVHATAEKDSLLVDSVPSGTSLEILDDSSGFKKVKLPSGTEGWVDAAFLSAEPPVPAQYANLLKLHENTKTELTQLSEKLKKVERELQIRQDELSNAKTTIQELRKNKNPPMPDNIASITNTEDLDAANEEIENLKKQLLAFKSAQKITAQTDDAERDSINAAEELATLRARIELAMQNLKGKEVLTLDDIASIRPSMPSWFWGLIILVLVIGIAGGVLFMDYRNRKRHGGFRV